MIWNRDLYNNPPPSITFKLHASYLFCIARLSKFKQSRYFGKKLTKKIWQMQHQPWHIRPSPVNPMGHVRQVNPREGAGRSWQKTFGWHGSTTQGLKSSSQVAPDFPTGQSHDAIWNWNSCSIFQFVFIDLSWNNLVTTRPNKPKLGLPVQFDNSVAKKISNFNKETSGQFHKSITGEPSACVKTYVATHMGGPSCLCDIFLSEKNKKPETMTAKL